MNDDHSLLSDSFKEAGKGSSINAPGNQPEVTLGGIIADIETTFGMDENYLKGKSKNSKPKFSLTEYLKSFNLIIYDHLVKNNKDLSAENKFLIKTYFDSMLHMYDILRCVDLKVAETELLSYTTGYNIQTLKKFYDRYRKVQEAED